MVNINNIEVKKIDKEFVHYECSLSGFYGVKRVKLEKNLSFIEAIEKNSIDSDMWKKLRD